MDEEAPRWVYAVAGVSLILYQILDVADGKQARKTGNSSPLGLLFDHGCDALNVVISACTFAATIQSGATYWVCVCVRMMLFGGISSRRILMCSA